MKQGVFITGALGYLGRNLAAFLLEKKHKVYLCDVVRTREAARLVDMGGEFMCQDSCRLSPAALGKLKRCATVIHLACATTPATSEADPASDIRLNLAGTAALLRDCGDAGIKKFIFASSGGTVYGAPEKLPVTEASLTEPTNMHGAMKLASEVYIKAFSAKYGFDFALLRIANLYGPRQKYKTLFGAAAVFTQAVLEGKPIHVWGSGGTTRDYIYIDDTVSAFEAAVRCEAVKGIFNVSTGKGTSLNALIRLIENVTGRKAKVEYLHSRRLDVPASVLSSRKLGRVSGWQPATSLREGIGNIAKSLA